MPRVAHLPPHRFLSLSLFRNSKNFQFLPMAARTHFSSSETEPENDPKILQNYPVPLSPPLPTLSKDIELNRALVASSKSERFSLSRSDILFEDEWLIAVNKPQGIYCESVLSAVSEFIKNGSTHQGDQLNSLELHLANRLDRDTSGVTVITKSHKVAAKLVKAFTDHKVKKTYLAVCIGPAPKWDNIIVKSGHGRSKHGAWRVYSVSDVGRTLPGGSIVRDMETLFEVVLVNGQQHLGEFKEHEDNAIVVKEKSSILCDVEKLEVVLRAYPKTGRTHQIRLHCQYLGLPIRGDVKYAGIIEWRGRTYDAHELHAESLSFEHPVTAGQVLIKAHLPLWASQALGSSSV